MLLTLLSRSLYLPNLTLAVGMPAIIFRAVLASYRRNLGPGVQYRLNFMWADYEGEEPGKADDNSGVAVTTSVRLSF